MWTNCFTSCTNLLQTACISNFVDAQIPQLQHSDDIDPSLILLRKEYAWHIGGALSPNELEEWKLLYHSAVHGLSFSTFLGNIL